MFCKIEVGKVCVLSYLALMFCKIEVGKVCVLDYLTFMFCKIEVDKNFLVGFVRLTVLFILRWLFVIF